MRHGVVQHVGQGPGAGAGVLVVDGAGVGEGGAQGRQGGEV